MIAHVNGIDLYYERTGAGRPVVLVHGNGEDHTIFDEAVEVLRGRFTCYCVDSRGHGRSTRVDALHYADMAADVVALMDTLALTDVVFYGFSDGGIVGLLTAMRSGRISDLIVSGANLTPRGVRPSLRLELALLSLFKRDPKITLMRREPQINATELKRIRARTLVLAGSGDLILEQETRRIAAGIPGAELRILPGEDHGSYIIHNPRIGEIIRDFASADDRGRKIKHA